MTGAAQGGQGDPRAPSAQRGLSGLRGKSILYVDDDPLVRRAASHLLRGTGTICLLAGTHDQAVAVTAAEPALALAILDFHMPDGPVGHLVKRLRDARPELPLIGTSGVERRSEFAQHGVTQFLEKPWQLGALERAVELVCASTPRVRPGIPKDPWISAQHLRE